MSIQWYPGHMNKARRDIADAMPSIDVVIEVLDARLPHSSENPMIAALRGAKPCLKILNKSDLADPEITQRWISSMESKPGTAALALSMKKPLDAKAVPKLCRKLGPTRGTLLKPLRVMIMGIPNAGKSTLINALTGRKTAKVADEPAVTKMQQHIELEKGLLLVDTPGITWPKIENETSGYNLAATGAIGKNAMDSIEVAKFVANYLIVNYPELLRERYGFDALPQDGTELIEAIGRRRGCLKVGCAVDMEKSAEILLNEFRSGKIGRISLEKPEAH
ncbi:MAG: ribosome biogenesis GTPase YlqF [Burkholderiales bacterium]|nr:ribosome biogenesis GTPase YlqF [Burkholderiales bacterium]